MVAGYAIGGGHVLHVVATSRSPRTTRASVRPGPQVGSLRWRLRRSRPRAAVGQKKANEIWFLCRQYDASRPSTWVSSTRSSRSSELEAGDGEVVPRDARTLPLRAAPAQGELQRRRGRPPAMRQLAHDANLLFYTSDEAQEGRNAYLEKRPARTSRSSRAVREPASTHGPWRRGLRTLPPPLAPVPVATRRALATGSAAPRAAAFVAALVGSIFIQVGPTSRTTTPTPSTAPTARTGSVRCSVTARAWSRPTR